MEDPKQLFNRQKDEHIQYLRDQKMIDNYSVQFDHFIEKKIAEDEFDELKSKLSSESYEFLNSQVKHIKVGDKVDDI